MKGWCLRSHRTQTPCMNATPHFTGCVSTRYSGGRKGFSAQGGAGSEARSKWGCIPAHVRGKAQPHARIARHSGYIIAQRGECSSTRHPATLHNAAVRTEWASCGEGRAHVYNLRRAAQEVEHVRKIRRVTEVAVVLDDATVSTGAISGAGEGERANSEAVYCKPHAATRRENALKMRAAAQGRAAATGVQAPGHAGDASGEWSA